MLEDPPLSRLSVQADISPVNNIHWRVTGTGWLCSIELLCDTGCVQRKKPPPRRPSSTQMSSRAKWAGSAFRRKSSWKRNIKKQYLYILHSMVPHNSKRDLKGLKFNPTEEFQCKLPQKATSTIWLCFLWLESPPKNRHATPSLQEKGDFFNSPNYKGVH